MTINKDSPEVVEFMRLFKKLNDWSDNALPDALPKVVSEDESIKELCLELFKAAGSVQRQQHVNPKLFNASLDSTFKSNWRDFEERYAPVLITILMNNIEAGEFQHALSFDWYNLPPNWEKADSKAASAAEIIEATINSMHVQADNNMHLQDDNNMPEDPFRPNVGHLINIDLLPVNLREHYDKVMEAEARLKEAFKNEEELIRNEMQSSNDESYKSELNKKLIDLERDRQEALHHIIDEETLGWGIAEWKSLRDEVGFDLRGVLRRRMLVPFVLVPRHVDAHHDHDAILWMYKNLQQAHEAFVFGVPFAALALMRSILENVLRDLYRTDGETLRHHISKSRGMLPDGVNVAQLHRLADYANAILHANIRGGADSKVLGINIKSRDRVASFDQNKLELEIVSLLYVLRALIEGVP